MATDLSPRQRDALKVIADSLRSSGRAPTQREICASLGLTSTNSAAEYFEVLERKGYITRPDAVQARAAAVTDKGWLALGYTKCPHCSQLVEPGKAVA
jgi:repressor LexA